MSDNNTTNNTHHATAFGFRNHRDRKPIMYRPIEKV